MSTFYIPSDSGWNDNGTMGAAAKLRLKVDRTYNASTNRSSLTITLQGLAPNYSGKYYLLDNASISLNGSTIFSGGGSGSQSLSYYVQYQGDSTWHDLKQSNGNTYSWTATVNHSTDGTATAQFNVSVRLYTSSYYFTFYSVSGSASINETRQFTLSISAGTGSTITVKKGTTTLSNGATVTYGDSLIITFTANTGYDLGTHTVNGSTFTSGGTHTVTGAVSVVSTATKKTFTLAISAGTGSSITVKKGTTTLSNGATITYGDILTVTFGVSTGYNLGTHTVNGSTFTSGNNHTVTGAVSVISSATVKSFTLSVSVGAHTTIVVNRTSSLLGSGSTGNLSNGSTIYYNDVLEISFSVSDGCVLSTHTVNGSAFTSGSSHTVTAAVSVVSSATVNSYQLSLTAGNYVTLSVNRTSSPVQGAAEGYLSNGSTIYYGDILSVTYAISVGATVSVHTLNGSDFVSGVSHTVSASVTVIVQATLNTYTITKSLDAHSALTIQRTSSPYGNGSTGVLSDESLVYYGDVLELTASTDTGYGIDTMSINSEQYSDNPHVVIVDTSLLIEILSKALGFIYIDSGASINKYKILIDSGASYEQYRAMIDTGSEIVPY